MGSGESVGSREFVGCGDFVGIVENHIQMNKNYTLIFSDISMIFIDIL
jgi:hypothetical protein